MAVIATFALVSEPPARTTQQTRWTNRSPEEQHTRARPQEKRRPSPHFGQARSRENTPDRRQPVTLTPRRELPRTRQESRTRFGRYNNERNRITTPAHRQTTLREAEVLRQPAEASSDSRGQTARGLLRGRPNRKKSHREGDRGTTPSRSPAPRRQPREPSHPAPDADPGNFGYNFRNAPPEVLEWRRNRITPSDQELRNPKHSERPAPDDRLCELCARKTSFIALCAIDHVLSMSGGLPLRLCQQVVEHRTLSNIRDIFPEVKELNYDHPDQTPFSTNAVWHEHNEIIKTIANHAVKKFKSLRPPCGKARVPPAMASLTASFVKTLVLTSRLTASTASRMSRSVPG